MKNIYDKKAMKNKSDSVCRILAHKYEQYNIEVQFVLKIFLDMRIVYFVMKKITLHYRIEMCFVYTTIYFEN